MRHTFIISTGQDNAARAKSRLQDLSKASANASFPTVQQQLVLLLPASG
jgi:hypothetical protein